LNQKDTKEAFQTDIALALGDHDPSEMKSDELESTIHSVTLKSENIIPAKPKCRRVFP